jgi:cytochrome c oxidase subunit 3
MALAVRSSQLKKRKALVFFLLLTMFLGSIFLGIKFVEYYDKFKHHLIPGPSFHYEDQALARPAQLFISLYFAMTGLHALHMIIGISVLAIMCFHSWRGRYTSGYYWPIEVSGLYWHFVDIVWIFLFPFLYLISRHG